jgi:hypothetical protein
MPTAFDVSNSGKPIACLYCPDFWPRLLFRLCDGLPAVPPDGSAVLDPVEVVSAVSGPATVDSFVLDWKLSSLGVVRSDTITASNAQAASHHERRITEDAAIGLTACTLEAYATGLRMTRVAKFGKRLDYFLNGYDDEMIEISGSNSRHVTIKWLAKKKTKQAKLGQMKAAWIFVCNFKFKAARLEKVV